jgi:hypothetical protein
MVTVTAMYHGSDVLAVSWSSARTDASRVRDRKVSMTLARSARVSLGASSAGAVSRKSNWPHVPLHKHNLCVEHPISTVRSSAAVSLGAKKYVILSLELSLCTLGSRLVHTSSERGPAAILTRCPRLQLHSSSQHGSVASTHPPPAPPVLAHAKPPQLALRCVSAAPNDRILATVPGAHPALIARQPATRSQGRLRDGLTNVGPMSQQLDAQGNTSPPASVRARTPGPGHASSQAPAEHDAVTPKTLAQTGRSKTAPIAPDSSALWKSSTDRPQLSERDSIFATTYLVADTPTSSPRTSARLLAPDDDAPEHSLSDMAAPAPPQRRLIDAPVFRRKQSTYPPVALDDHHTLLATHFNSRKPIAVGMDSDGMRHSPPPYMSPVDSPVQRPVTPHLPNVQSALDERLEDSEERKRNIAWRVGQPVPFRGTGAPDSSAGNTEGEKKIDVTLAKVEQPASARSRKASHFLRVFKDADGGDDQRKRDSRAKERRPVEKKLPALQEDVQAKTGGKDVSALTEQLQRLSRPSSAVQSPVGGPTEQYFEKVPTPRSENDPSALSNHVDSTPAAKETIYKRPLPNYVLDEIRAIADITPGAPPGSSFSRSLPTSAAEKFHAHASTAGVRHHYEEPGDYFQAKKECSPERSPASEEEDDSEREQISSALYFPHRRLKTSEQGSNEVHDSKAEVEGIQDKSSFTGAGARGRADGQAPQTPQEVEISLQSKDTNQCLYGDISTTASVRHEDEAPLNATNIDPLSAESESESLAESTHSLLGYESSATDDLGTTPTATTRAKEHKAAPAPAPAPQPEAPVDAVELKPYDHQVGGHSTVYRFSKRAVCKQLNNRENEFYETVEQHHPELLDFLPR